MSELAMDSEYNAHQVICVAFRNRAGDEWLFDTRHDVEPLRAFLALHCDDEFIAYNIRAEIGSLCRLGLPVPAQWIDLLPEVVQIVGTHERFLQWGTDERGKPFRYSPKSFRLTDALRHLTDIKSDFDKREMYELILSRNVWSDDEFERIGLYCQDDTRVLFPLLDAITAFHREVCSPWRREFAHHRGRVIRASAVMQHGNRGTPVNAEWIKTVYSRKRDILTKLVDDCHRRYGFPLYRMNGETATVDLQQCAAFARHWGIPWRVTATGKTSLQKDYLESLSREDRSDLIDQFGNSCPSLREFKRLRDLERNLSKNPWLEGDRYEPPLVKDGYVAIADVVSTATVTGRSKMLRSHIQNQSPLFRTMIAGNDDVSYIGADWSQQEIALALHYFPDARLREAFEALPPRFHDDPRGPDGEYLPRRRDIYLNLAVMAGAISGDMDRAQRDLIRQGFKSVQLGVGYGMGEDALGRKLYADLNAGRDIPVISEDEAAQRARTILNWHKRTFRDYWRGVERFVREARRAGYYMSCDGWIYFVHRGTKATQLQNLKMQCNGAAMLRQAILGCEREGLQFVAEHHDAIYIIAPHDAAEYCAAKLVNVMNDAAAKVIKSDIKISVDAKIYGKGEKYKDSRADAIKDMIERNM